MWDDVSLIEQNPTLDDARNIPRYFVEDLGLFNRDPRRMGFYRPLQALSFHLEVALFGRNAPLQRAINVAWHVLGAAALWLLAASLGLPRHWAFAAGLLFALHPLCTEQVCLVANRGGVLTGVLSLWTLALLARAIPHERGVRAGYLVAAAGCCLAALLAKPEALTLAAPAAAWVYLARPARRRDASTWLAAVGIPGLLAIVFAIWHWVILNISHAHKAVVVEGGLAVRLIAVPRLTLEALKLALLPIGLRPLRTFDYGVWSALPVAALATVAWVAIFALAWRLRRRTPAFAYATVMFAATMAPSAGLVPLVRPIAEHYYYLPTAAVALALAGAGVAFGQRRATQVMLAVLLAVFAALTAHRAWVWRSEESLWADNLAQDPTNAQALNNLGTFYAEAGDTPRAFEMFSRSLAVSPGNLKARLNRAHLAVSIGKWDIAEEDVRLLLAADPCQTKTLVQLGRLGVLHPTPATEMWINDWRKQRACAAVIDVGAGLSLDELGRHVEARAAFDRFLAAAPNHPLAPAVRQRQQTQPGVDELRGKM